MELLKAIAEWGSAQDIRLPALELTVHLSPRKSYLRYIQGSRIQIELPLSKPSCASELTLEIDFDSQSKNTNLKFTPRGELLSLVGGDRIADYAAKGEGIQETLHLLDRLIEVLDAFKQNLGSSPPAPFLSELLLALEDLHTLFQHWSDVRPRRGQLETRRFRAAYRAKRGIIWPRGHVLEPLLEHLPDGGPVRVPLPEYPGVFAEGTLVPGRLSAITTYMKIERFVLGAAARATSRASLSFHRDTFYPLLVDHNDLSMLGEYASTILGIDSELKRLLQQGEAERVERELLLGELTKL